MVLSEPENSCSVYSFEYLRMQFKLGHGNKPWLKKNEFYSLDKSCGRNNWMKVGSLDRSEIEMWKHISFFFFVVVSGGASGYYLIHCVLVRFGGHEIEWNHPFSFFCIHNMGQRRFFPHPGTYSNMLRFHRYCCLRHLPNCTCWSERVRQAYNTNRCTHTCKRPTVYSFWLCYSYQ